MEDSMVAYYQNHQWKVTELGIESLSPDFDYEVEAERLLEVAERNGETLYDLPVHMAEKCWVDIEAFIAAFEKALAIHASRYKPELDEEMLAASFRAARREAQLETEAGPGAFGLVPQRRGRFTTFAFVTLH
jgi:hypothetical protein